MRDVFHCDCLHPDGFTVTVDRSKTIREMIAAGRYNGQYVTEVERFAFEGKGLSTVRLGLLHLHAQASFEEVMAAIERRRVRPADAAELLAFGAQHPEIQTRRKVVCLGSVVNEEMCEGWITALALDGSQQIRELDCCFLENSPLSEGVHILVVLP